MDDKILLEELVDRLSCLSEEELIYLRSEIDRRLGAISYGDGKVVYEAIVKRLKGERYPPINVYMKGKNAGRFVSFSENCVNLSKQLKAPNIVVFMDIMVKSIIDYLTERKIPVTFNTVINQKDHLLDVLDESFPGYRESGLLAIVWNSIMGKKLRK